MAVTETPYETLQALSGEREQHTRNGERLSPSEPSTRRIEHIGFRSPGKTEIFHYDEEALPEDSVRIRTLYCGISTGTELTHFQGTNPAMNARWDEEMKLFAGQGGQEYPLPFSGYMQVGQIAESRSPGYRKGEIVAMTYGHKTGHTADPMRELLFPLPADLDPILGIYVAQMGPICANAVLHADEEAYGAGAEAFGSGVRGRNVMICGTGVIGLMVGMMCLWAGADEVAVAGRNPWKLNVAESLGLLPVSTEKTDPGRWAKQRWHDGAGNRGAHVAFQCSGSDELLHHALRTLQPQGAVVDLGFYQQGASQAQFGQEFHHNSLKHICAQVSRLPRKLSSQWDRRRLAATTLAFLSARGDAVRNHLITHILPFSYAQQAYETLASGGKQALQIVLECD